MADAQWFDIFQVTQSIVMGLAAVFAWIWGRQQKAEKDLIEARFTQIEERQKDNEQVCSLRNERINQQLSDKLVPAVQLLIGKFDRLPDELRDKFLPLDRALDIINESRRDRDALWAELKRRGNRGAERDAHK